MLEFTIMEDFNRKVLQQIDLEIQRLNKLIEQYPLYSQELLQAFKKTLDKFERRRIAEILMDREALSLMEFIKEDTAEQMKMRVKNVMIKAVGFKGTVSQFVDLIIQGGIQSKSKSLPDILIFTLNIKEPRVAYILIGIFKRCGLLDYIKLHIPNSSEQ